MFSCNAYISCHPLSSVVVVETLAVTENCITRPSKLAGGKKHWQESRNPARHYPLAGGFKHFLFSPGLPNGWLVGRKKWSRHSIKFFLSILKIWSDIVNVNLLNKSLKSKTGWCWFFFQGCLPRSSFDSAAWGPSAQACPCTSTHACRGSASAGTGCACGESWLGISGCIATRIVGYPYVY